MNKQRNHLLNDKKMIELIKQILYTINYRENPSDMDVYRKLISRHVPIFRRRYFVAYLFKLLSNGQSLDHLASPKKSKTRASEKTPKNNAIKGKGGKKNKPVSKNPASGKSEAADLRANAKSSVAETDLDTKSIFVGIGRSRDITPEWLKELFYTVEGVNSDDVGAVRIFEHYSFVEVTPVLSQKIVQTLDGKEYKGRKLSISIARVARPRKR